MVLALQLLPRGVSWGTCTPAAGSREWQWWPPSDHRHWGPPEQQ